MSAGNDRPVLWTAKEAAAATRGRNTAPWRATGVAIDSRTLAPGDLFVALKGPNFDGHDFVARAFKAGAAAALVSALPEGVTDDQPMLAVEDTFAALQDLGRVARLRTRARTIAVTGSVGKTGTKEALLACLSAQAPAYATQGSLNNHWGVPLSLARLPVDCRWGIFELGMNHAGEIGPLSRQVRPEVAIITTVEPAHLEFFPSVEAIADAKAEIFEGMAPDGVAVLNRDNPQYGRLLAAARTAGIADIRSFGTHERADARLVECALHPTCSTVTAEIGRERLQYCVALPGRHWVMNSLGLLLAVGAAGGDVAAAARTLGQLQPVKGRGTRQRIRLTQGALTLIDESYNASPAAMEATFQVLARLDPGAGGRRLAVLGDMRELGSRSEALHAGLAEPLIAAGVDLVFCAGPHMARLYESLPAGMRGAHCESSAELAPRVAGAVEPGDVVLVKGSAGSRMATVVEALKALDQRDQNGSGGIAGRTVLAAAAAQ